MHGDIVCQSKSPTAQTGTIIGVTELVDLEYSPQPDQSTQKLKGVPTQILQPVIPPQGTMVVKDGWLGKITQVDIDVEVTFPDATVCLLHNVDPSILQLDMGTSEVPEDYIDESLYFPSQKVSHHTRNLSLGKSQSGSAQEGKVVERQIS